MTNKTNVTDLMFCELNGLLDRIINHLSLTNFTENKIDRILSALNIFIKATSIVDSSTHSVHSNNKFSKHKELQIHMLSILKGIKNAQSSNDIIMLTDLLEYELVDNLKQWKILILPLMKVQLGQSLSQ